MTKQNTSGCGEQKTCMCLMKHKKWYHRWSSGHGQVKQDPVCGSLSHLTWRHESFLVRPHQGSSVSQPHFPCTLEELWARIVVAVAIVKMEQWDIVYAIWGHHMNVCVTKNLPWTMFVQCTLFHIYTSIYFETWLLKMHPNLQRPYTVS
jgi:hypothetical protein